jgi:hypothetical protein
MMGNERGTVEGAREQILRAARRLDGGRGASFTIAEIVAEVRRYGATLADSTIRTHVTSRMCANAPKNHGTVYADLERVDRGRYRLAPKPGAKPQ